MGTANERAPEELFRLAFRRHANGVVVLTCMTPDMRVHGMTATSVCSLSLSPPQLLVCVNRQAKTRGEIAHAGHFGVNFLEQGQQDISEFCAVPGRHKVLPQYWYKPVAAVNVPLMHGVLAALACAVVHTHEETTHTVFIGQIIGGIVGDRMDPLVYFDGKYRGLDRAHQADAPQASSYETLFDAMVRAYS